MDGWSSFVGRVVSSPFLSGQNDRGWKADFDWCLKEANFVKITEGRYDPSANGPPYRPPAPVRESNADRLKRELGLDESLDYLYEQPEALQ